MTSETTSKNNSPRKPWRAPQIILAEEMRGADRFSNGEPTDAHTTASIITGDQHTS